MAPKKKAATAAAAAASPTGVQLSTASNNNNNNKKWTIGRQLGAGVQGGVYEILVNDGKTKTTASADWVVKVVPVPVITKKKTSVNELNANSLNLESLMYQVHLGSKLRGTYIPQVPNGSTEAQAYQKGVDGFNCLIMERMECSLMDTIPQLLTSSSSSTTINIGPIAAKLIELCQVIHDKLHLINDVKPDNIMVARSKSAAAAAASSRKRPSKTAAANVVDSIANRIRLVDFGLLTKCQPYDPSGTSGIVGNATYASLTMHALTTSSRRDDVEMMLYVICDLVLAVQAGKKTNGSSSLLPWSKGTSDEQVLEIKQASVQNRQSDFYKLLDPTSSSSNKKKSSTASILHQCLQKVWDLEFNTKPNYNEFKTLLGKLTVVVRPTASGTKKKAPPPAAAAATSTITRKSPAATKRRATASTSPHISSPTPSRASNVSSPTPLKRPARVTRRSAAPSASTNNDESTDDEEDASPSSVAAAPTRASSRVASSNKKKAASRTIATQTTGLTDTSNDRKRPAARSTRFRGRLSEDDDDEPEEESPTKIRKGSPEVIDLMDVDTSESEEEEEDIQEDDSDVEMEICSSDDNENVQPARPAKKKQPTAADVSVQLSIQTPNYEPHKQDLVEGHPLILGANPKQTKGFRLVEVPGAQPNHCRLELVVKKGKVMGITVTSLNGVTLVDGKAVPSKKSLICLGRKITLGDEDNHASVITISNY